MAFQDVAHGLVTEGVPKIGEGSHNPVVAPRAILLRHPDRLTPPVRGQSGDALVGLDDRGHFLQGLLPELLADLGEGCALTIAESHAPLPEIAKRFARCTRLAYDNLDQLLDRSTGANSANDCDTILTDA